MARLTITIEDQGPDRVQTVMRPSAESIIRKIAGHGPGSVTMAEAYAMLAIRTIDEAGKKVAAEGQSKIIIPRLGMQR